MKRTKTGVAGRAIPRTKRLWNGMWVHTHCQRCGAELPTGKPRVCDFQMLTRLCYTCYTSAHDEMSNSYEICAISKNHSSWG